MENIARIAAGAIAGGTAEHLGGGKFANGYLAIYICLF